MRYFIKSWKESLSFFAVFSVLSLCLLIGPALPEAHAQASIGSDLRISRMVWEGGNKITKYKRKSKGVFSPGRVKMMSSAFPKNTNSLRVVGVSVAEKQGGTVYLWVRLSGDNKVWLRRSSVQFVDDDEWSRTVSQVRELGGEFCSTQRTKKAGTSSPHNVMAATAMKFCG